MTRWIERYRRQAEERSQHLDALLERMADTTTETDTSEEQQDEHQ